MNPNAENLFILDDVHGVYVDAVVSHADTGALLFGSFWGRDTSIQELLARLSLGIAEGGLPALRLTSVEQPGKKVRILIEAADQLTKLSGRMPATSLFGEVTQVWIYVPVAAKPDYAGRRAMRVLRADPGVPGNARRDAAIRGEGAWAMLKEISHLPLLDEWREAVLELSILHGWVKFHAGLGADALEINLGTDAEAYEAGVCELIRMGKLRIPGNALDPEPAAAPPGDSGDSGEPPQGEADSESEESEDWSRRLTSDQLDYELRGFTGTENWYEHALVPLMLYTDGVRFFARQGGQEGAYWFLDVVATEFFPMLRKNPFLLVLLLVEDHHALIVVEDGNGRVLKERRIEYTDVQPGKWKFYLVDNVLLLPTEY